MGGGQSRVRPNGAAAQYPEVHDKMAYVRSFEEYKKMYDRSIKVGAGGARAGRGSSGGAQPASLVKRSPRQLPAAGASCPASCLLAHRTPTASGGTLPWASMRGARSPTRSTTPRTLTSARWVWGAAGGS